MVCTFSDREWASFGRISPAGLMELVKVGHSAFDLKALQKLQEVAAQVERHHLAIQRTLNELGALGYLAGTSPRDFE